MNTPEESIKGPLKPLLAASPEPGRGSWISRKIGSIVGPALSAIRSVLHTQPGISEESIALLEQRAEALPESLQQELFVHLLYGIKHLPPEKRKRITEEVLPDRQEIIANAQSNETLFILLKGTSAVVLKEIQEIILKPAPDILGEISVLKGVPTTASVETRGEVHVLKIPKNILDELCKVRPQISESLNLLIEERMKRTRSLAELKHKKLNSAQILAELAILQDDESVEADANNVLREVQKLALESQGIFQLEQIASGKKFLPHKGVIDKVRIVLSGNARMFNPNGASIGLLGPGDHIGAVDAFTPERRSSFEYAATSRMQVLAIEPEAFMALREQLEAILARERTKYLTHPAEPMSADAVQVPGIDQRELADIHKAAVQTRHYIPLRQSGNDLIVECGTAEEVLSWLGVRGLLSYKGSVGWKITHELPNGEFELQRPGGAPLRAQREYLIEGNVRKAFRMNHREDTVSAIKLYTDGGLTAKEAGYLVSLGLVPQRTPNIKHLARFQGSFEEIQNALAHITKWAAKPQMEQERKMLERMLRFLLIDTTHQIGITSLMMDPETRDIVLDCLDEMMAMPETSEGQFAEFVQKECGKMKVRYETEAVRWNGDGASSNSRMFRQNLLQHPTWGDVYKISSNELTPQQSNQLAHYVQTLEEEVCPALVDELSSMLSGSDSGSFPLITGRTKDPTGIVEKIRRVQRGNRGKEAKPKFCLADLPDAVGARVIVRDIAELEYAMESIERLYNTRVIEKDDFYANPKKQKHPYRLVTYTVECKGVPAEIQLQTLPSAVAAAIDHDIVYKPYVPASEPQRDLSASLLRRTAIEETKARVANGYDSKGDREHNTVEIIPLRHVYESTLKHGGRTVTTFLNEGSYETPEALAKDLRDARAYFAWQRSLGVPTTTHVGCSPVECTSCLGAPNWKKFREEKIAEAKTRPGVPPEVIEALVAENVPLFVLDAFADDLDTEGNIAALRAEAAERFSEEECAVIDRALVIIEREHKGQNYAIENLNDDGTPKYPNSLALKNIPYTNHCIQVARLGMQCGLPLEDVIGLLFHDMFEDTEAKIEEIRTEVSPIAVSSALTITKADTEDRPTYMARMKALTGKPKIMKALDRYHNLLRAFNLRDSEKYLNRIISESRDIFAGDFEPNAELSSLAPRFYMLLEAVEQLRDRKFPQTVEQKPLPV